MALYTTPDVAAARLGRYAGLSVPSRGGNPSAMDDLIAEASALMEGFLGYAWESQSFTETIPMSRDGQGKLLNADALYVPVTAVAAVSVPANAQYYGPTIQLDMLEWSADGQVVLAYPVVYSPQRWVNPIPLGRSAGYNAALKLYPDEITLTYTAGRADSPPAIFEPTCVRVMALLLTLQDDPDALLATKQKVEDLGLTTEYRSDPIGQAMRPLARWKR